MIDYHLFQYAGPPRTGSSWILKAAHVCGLGEGSKALVHLPFDDTWSGLRVITVRHPCDWLASYWRALWPGKMGLAEVDRLAELPGSSFPEFVRAYLDGCAGQVGRIFERYEADICLRLEDVPEAWVSLLRQFQVPQVLALKSTLLPVVNAARNNEVEWPKWLRDQVVDAELKLAEGLDYR